jgi:type IV pilus assembly protein PilM
MARGATHVLGLDIGTQTIKIVELRLSGQDVMLVGQPAIIPTPSGSVVGGRVVDEEAVSQALLEAASEYRFGVKKVVASVGGDSDVVVRIAELPRMETRELNEAVTWELERQTPFPVDQVVYDFQPVDHPGADPASPNMEVFLAVAQEEMVNAHAETLMTSKMVPVAIDVEPLALGRALVELGSDAVMQSTAVVVHMGHTHTLICIFCQGVPVFTRTIPTAGEAFTAAIRQRLGLSEIDADRAKRRFADVSDVVPYDDFGEHDEEDDDDGGLLDAEDESIFEVSDADADLDAGHDMDSTDDMATHVDVDTQAYELPPEPPTADDTATVMSEESKASGEQADPESDDERLASEHVSDALVDAITELATELQRSIQHYRRQHRRENISTIILSGGTASMRGIAEFITAETGIPVQVANPFANIRGNPAQVSEAYLRDVGPTVSIAVGLALRDILD